MSQPQLSNKYNNDSRRLQDLGLLRIFNYYRLLLSVVLVSGYFNEASKVFLGLEKPSLYLTTAVLYSGFNFMLLFALRKAKQLQPQQIIANICVDIITLGLLTYASGGVANGLGNLVIVAVAAGSILLSGRYSLLFAALGSITLTSVEIYRATALPDVSHHYLQAGLLGILLFATALFIRHISNRIKTSENLAQQRASDVAHLEKMNLLIIQRMRTGIAVCDPQGHIKMMNEAARELLVKENRDPNNTHEHLLPIPLKERLGQWLQNPQLRTTPFQISPEAAEVQANFAALRQQDTANILIFLEDNSKAAQHAQQLKLASLGQLTASIAHEIRNPLGAISHAAQLLAESESLDPADQRLSNIIQQHSVRMNDTIENVLELSRRKPAAPQTLQLSAWLNNFISSYNETETATGNFNLDINPASLEVRFDPSQLQQIVSNLCQNGLRYSQQKTGLPVIHLRAAMLAVNKQPYLDIIDEGPGIDTETAARLFEPFYTTERTGTGLGLYISRELCQANNARLDHIASYQNGCCFRIIFPHPKQLAD